MCHRKRNTSLVTKGRDFPRELGMVAVRRHHRQMMKAVGKLSAASGSSHSVERWICIRKDDETKLRRIVLSSLDGLDVQHEGPEVISGKGGISINHVEQL